MNLIRLTALSILLLSSLGAMAQQAIDSAMKSLEKSKSVTNEVYSERRDPDTKAVVSSNRLYEFTDDALANKIIEAIRKERGNASSFQMNNRNPNSGYAITFESKDGRSYSKYALVQNGELWVFSVVKSTARSSSSKKRSKDRSDYYEIPGVSLSFDDGLDQLKMAMLDDNGCSMITGLTSGILFDSKGKRIVVERKTNGSGRNTYTTTSVSCNGKMIVTTTKSTQEDNDCAAEARRAAAEARAEARRAAAEARAQAAEARAEAAEARKEAAEARKEAAKARVKASKSRKSQKSNKSTYYYFSSLD